MLNALSLSIFSLENTTTDTASDTSAVTVAGLTLSVILTAVVALSLVFKALRRRSVTLIRSVLRTANISADTDLIFHESGPGSPVVSADSVLSEWCSRGSLGIAESYVRGCWSLAPATKDAANVATATKDTMNVATLKEFYLRMGAMDRKEIVKLMRSPTAALAAVTVKWAPSWFNNVTQSKLDIASHCKSTSNPHHNLTPGLILHLSNGCLRLQMIWATISVRVHALSPYFIPRALSDRPLRGQTKRFSTQP